MSSSFTVSTFLVVVVAFLHVKIEIYDFDFLQLE